jgi:hypothetical protein
LTSLLLNRGLSHQEVDRFEDHLIYAKGFERDSVSVLIEGIANKYAMLLLKFRPNRHAKEFLKEITVRELSNYLLIKVESTVKDEHFGSERHEIDHPERIETKNGINEMIDVNGKLLFAFLDEQVYTAFSNRHICNEVKDIISCLFSIFHLPKEYVEQWIKEETEEINSLPPPKVSPYLDEAEVKRIHDTLRKIYNYVAELNASA